MISNINLNHLQRQYSNQIRNEKAIKRKGEIVTAQYFFSIHEVKGAI